MRSHPNSLMRRCMTRVESTGCFQVLGACVDDPDFHAVWTVKVAIPHISGKARSAATIQQLVDCL